MCIRDSSKGIDKNKDQSYALWGVSQESLSRTILPLGQLTKDQIREEATKRGFVNLVTKSESYEICFVPDNDYRGFLKRRVEGLEEAVKGGEFVLSNGEVIGTHEGYPFYTIGQRKGLGVALGYPAYVIEIQKDLNRVVLGPIEELAKNAMKVHKLTFGKFASFGNEQYETIVKVRYNDKGSVATVKQISDNELEVFFHEKVNAIAPGQAAVFYHEDDVLAGGWIQKSFDSK